MLDQRKYVFIIGAGASMPYGFPSGDGLFNSIRSEFTETVWDCYETGNKETSNPERFPEYSKAARFCEALEYLSGVSIDKYLNINKTYKDIGVQAIATTILKYEGNSKLLDITDDWYTHLFMKLTEGLDDPKSLLKIGDNKVGFITFNYDRSLEYYLHRNLAIFLEHSATSHEEVNMAFSKLTFIHVYGKVGHLPFQLDHSDEENPIIEYGSSYPTFLANGHRAAKLIEVMYDTRKESNEINRAQELILGADKIFFLGFGFDELNLKILGFPIDVRSKTIWGTAYQKTDNEIVQYQRKISAKFQDKRPFLINCKTTDLLRNYLY